MKITTSIIVILLALGVGAFLWWQFDAQNVEPAVASFEDCVAAGNPVMESYPRQCRHGDDLFVEDISDEEAPDGILPFDSGVRGTVLLGPICPVQSFPPDPNCADKGYQTTVRVFSPVSSQIGPYASVETGEDGTFEFSLPPGIYTLEAIGGEPLPRCERQEVTIEPGIILMQDISCDSGIR